MSATAAIECVGLSKVFRDFWMRARVTAVSGLDLTVGRGEVFGLLGPNGSGKSTTIKLILGLLHPTSGRLRVLDEMPGTTRAKHRIGYLPEDSYLYRFLDAQELLDYYGRLFGLSRTDRAKRSAALLEMVGLDGVKHRPIGEYSKGMQRRIGLAQALINDPDLLILDEPTAGMDPIGARQMKDLVIALKKRGKTILLCSHLLAEVEDVCDTIAIMYGGRKRIEGRVSELLSVSDRQSIESDVLSPPQLAEVVGQVERATGGKVTVSRPRQTLEALFLDIVAAAQAEGAATSGAAAGGRVAEFLAVGGPSHAPADQVLRELLEVDKSAHVPPPRHDAAPLRAADTAVLGGLVESAPTVPGTAAPGAAVPAEAPAERRAAPTTDRSVIDDLLDGDR